MDGKKDSLMVQIIGAIRGEIYPYIVFIIGLLIATCVMSFACVVLIILGHLNKKKT